MGRDAGEDVAAGLASGATETCTGRPAPAGNRVRRSPVAEAADLAARDLEPEQRECLRCVYDLLDLAEEKQSAVACKVREATEFAVYLSVASLRDGETSKEEYVRRMRNLLETLQERVSRLTEEQLKWSACAKDGLIPEKAGAPK